MYFETQKLSVGYHRQPLIKDIDIGIWQGGILCLIGPNGSGNPPSCAASRGIWPSWEGWSPSAAAIWTR